MSWGLSKYKKASLASSGKASESWPRVKNEQVDSSIDSSSYGFISRLLKSRLIRLLGIGHWGASPDERCQDEDARLNSDLSDFHFPQPSFEIFKD